MMRVWAMLFFMLLPWSAQAQTLLLFWRDDCVPCREELRLLPAYRADNPDLRMQVMTLRGEPQGVPADVKVEAVTTQQLKDYGDARMALPFSAMAHDDGSMCETHYGILGTDLVTRWNKRC